MYLNHLAFRGNYSATSNNMKLVPVHWPLMGGPLHFVQRKGAWAGCGPAQSLLAVPNVTHTHTHVYLTKQATRKGEAPIVLATRSQPINSPPINGQCTGTNFILFDVAL